MKVLVADDSSFFRKAMTEVLSSLPGVEVVGSASNGRLTLQKVQELRPDLLTLDMEMPELDGLAVLDALKTEGNMPAVIVVSALTREGGKLALQALQKGAFDFITKPDTSNAGESRKILRTEFETRLKALSLRLGVRNILRGTSSIQSPPSSKPLISSPSVAPDTIVDRMRRVSGISKPEMVLIGVSTGGPNALGVLLPALPRLGVPVLIVQHMPAIFTQTLAESLSVKCVLRVLEASHGQTAEADTVYIAPGGRQMRLAPAPDGRGIIRINDDPPENNCRPSVDTLFRSVALHFPGRAMGVILTGMGNDGTLGLKLLRRSGCFVIAQDEPSCVVFGMPKSAIDAGVVDEVLPLEAIPARIARVVHGGSL